MNKQDAKRLASKLCDKHLNRKIAEFIGWKCVNGKWWHDDIGDGPPSDFVAMFGRKTASVIVQAILRK